MAGFCEIQLESISCPLGCLQDDVQHLVGRDRLHGLPGEFNVVRCSGCGLMRTNPRPTPETIGYYYPNGYGPYQSTQIGLPASQKLQARSWKRIMRRVFDMDPRKIPALQPGRLLEIGCASGGFLRQMAGLGWNVEGLEFSEKTAKAASSLGFPVQVGRLEIAHDPREPYDLIVGWMVFEHLHDPIHALQKLRCWTKPNGWLAISVPDASSLECKIFKDTWYALQLPTHLFHYSPKTLGKVLARGGWKIERLFWHNNPNNLLQSLRYRCMDRGWNALGDYFLDVVQGRRHRFFHDLMGKLLGTLHASGRMTVWARRV